MKTLIFAILVTAMTPVLSLAQSDDKTDRKAEQQALRKELLQKIEKVKHEKLVKQLGLDEASAPKFFELYKPAEHDIQTLARERNEEMKKLRDLMQGAKSDADVDPEMQKIRDLNQQIESRELKLDTDLKSVLSSRQRARLLVFEHEFNQRVRREVAKRQLGAEGKALRQQLREERRQNQLQKKLNKAGQR